ncbi:MAG: GNAT family N-acetyltransferase [Marmoricola sp.]
MPEPSGAEAGDLMLRPATTQDLPDVAELFLATRAAAVPAMPPVARPAEQVRAFVRSWDLSRPGEREVWLAADDLGPAGFAVLKGDWLDALYVAPERQGTGVGSALLDLVRAQRPRGFGLWVFASNAPARAFYRRHGLLELEHTDGSDNEEGAPDVHVVWPGEDPLAGLRAEVDAVDEELAPLLARRFALVAAIQGHKERAGLGAGHGGRDAARERAIVERMVQHAPGLSTDALGPVMDAVITACLSDWEAHR